MRKIVLIMFYTIISSHSFAQITLIRDGIVINNTETGIWGGDNIPRSEPTIFTYRNNSITSVNTKGYMLQAGDEGPRSTNNNLDGEVISGNKFVWNGVSADTVITHGLFTGYNINSVIKYNYLDKVPYGILFKSGTDAGMNMTFTSGGCAYNICRDGKFAVTMKGINGVKIYNNTFYNGNGSGWYFIIITANIDRTIPTPSTESRIYNNIFYSTIKQPMISIQSGCFSGFECDYNVYWCVDGEPYFLVDGASKTWTEWKSLGYDAHSLIADPNFINTTDLVPSVRLDYGKNLGDEWETGLSTTSDWITGISPATAVQNGTWQVGARIYNEFIYVNSINLTGVGGSDSIYRDNGTLQLTTSILPENSNNRLVTWSIINGTGQAAISDSGLVTAIENGTVTATATAIDGSGVYGSIDITISNQGTLSFNINRSIIKDQSCFAIVSSDKLKVMFDHNFISYKASLYNLQGALISVKNMDSDSIIFDISNLRSGPYIVVVSKGAHIKVIKVLKP